MGVGGERGVGEWGRLAVGNGNETWGEELERNKETPACQTVVARDGPELA